MNIEQLKRNSTPWVTAYPCMYDHAKVCENCKMFSTNVEDLRLTLRPRSIKYIFNKEGIDVPTLQHLCDLLFGFENPDAVIYSDALETMIRISPDLRKLGKKIAEVRRAKISKLLRNPEIVREFDFDCSVYDTQQR